MDYLPASNDITNIKGGTIIIDISNYILMVHQENGKWSLPKGSQKVGEDIFTTAFRETLEETQFDIRPYERNVVDIVTLPFNDGTYTFYIYKLPIHHDNVTYNHDKPLDSHSIQWILDTKIISTLGGKNINKITRKVLYYIKTEKKIKSGSGNKRHTRKNNKKNKKNKNNKK